MALSKNTKLVILMAIPLITFLLPAPEGLYRHYRWACA